MQILLNLLLIHALVFFVLCFLFHWNIALFRKTLFISGDEIASVVIMFLVPFYNIYLYKSLYTTAKQVEKLPAIIDNLKDIFKQMGIDGEDVAVVDKPDDIDKFLDNMTDEDLHDLFDKDKNKDKK